MAELAANAREWAQLPAPERAALVGQTARRLARQGEDWVAASLAAKGMPRGGMAEAEEWLFVATALRALRQLGSSLQEVAAGRHPVDRMSRRRSTGDRDVLPVFPTSRLDRLVYRGMSGRVRLERRRPLDDHAGLGGGARGGVAAVLGAGNASMLPVVDILHQLVVERRVVALKPSPVNAYLGPLIERAFEPFVRCGFLRLVHGGGDEGAYLCRHEGVDAVHLTGSHETYRAIAEGGKPVTSELGSVSPVIVVPGPWDEDDIECQAERIATWLVANAGFGCLTPRVLIQHREWPLRERLLGSLRRVLAGVPTRPAYYPGAEQRFAAFTDAHPEAWLVGRDGNGRLPWTVVPDVDPAATGDVCFRREAFCGLVAETALPAATPAEFVEEAVRFANTALWGTLVATLLVHPSSAADAAVAPALQRAVEELRYGTVTVNSAAFAAYHLQVLPWGAYPPRAPSEIESGCGKTGNGLLLRHVEKSVLRGPFAGRPDPLRVTARRPELVARRLAANAAAPSARRLPGLAASALAADAAARRRGSA